LHESFFYLVGLGGGRWVLQRGIVKPATLQLVPGNDRCSFSFGFGYLWKWLKYNLGRKVVGLRTLFLLSPFGLCTNLTDWDR